MKLMKKYTFLATISTLLLSAILLAQPVVAQTNATASDSGTTTEKLRERIERIVEEKRDQVKGVLDEISVGRRAMVGEVIRVSDEAITVKTRKTTLIIALTNQVALFKKNQPTKVSDIAVGDWAIAVGTMNNDSFQPDRVYLTSTSLEPKPKMVIVGTLNEVTRTNVTVTPRNATQNPTTLLITKATVYQDMNGNTLAAKNFKPDSPVLVLGAKTNDQLQLTVIRLLTPPASPTP
jgi:hypothetical protein